MNKKSLKQVVKGTAAATALIARLLLTHPTTNLEAIAQEKGTTITETTPITETAPLTPQEIDRYMRSNTIEDILQGTKVKYIKPYEIEKELEGPHKRPALLLLDSPLEYGTKSYLSRGSAIIFRSLAEKYEDRIDFYVTEGVPTDWSERAKNMFGVLPDYVHGVPSIAMYSPYDITKGETPQKNNGKRKLIDTLRGGPDQEKIEIGLKILPVWWVEPNLFNKNNPDGDGKLYRFDNTGKLHVIEGVKVPVTSP